jgi:transposase
MKKSVLKYEVRLNEEQREFLEKLTRKGKESVRKINRAKVLLLADEGKKDKEIQETLRISDGTVERVRKRFVLEGLDVAINEKPRPGQPKKLDGRGEAILIATACSNPPEGRADWSIRLLADTLVELNVKRETIRTTLKKMKLNPG